MRQEILDKLGTIVGARRVTADETDLLVYECDALALFKHKPDVVVFPASAREVSEVVRLANEYQIPFLPRGAGTGLSGGAIAADGGIIIELQQMNRVVSIDAENRFAVLQPGVVNLDVSRAVSPYGLYYAPDPSSQMACSIGGNVAENAGGPHCLKYGMTTNHILELEVVLATGEIVRIGNKAGDPVGYDLVGLVVGSEGTFAIVTEITVRLLRKPNGVKTLLAAFSSVEACSQTVSAVIAAGIVPSALEFVDQKTTEAVEASVYRAGYRLDAAASLLIEVDGFDVALEETADSIRSICESNGSYDIRVAEDEEQRARIVAGPQRRVRGHGAHQPRHDCHGRRHPQDAASRGPDSDPGYFRKLRPARGERVPRRRREPAPADPLRQPTERPCRPYFSDGGRDNGGLRQCRWCAQRGARHRAREERVHADGLHRRRPGRHATDQGRL